MALTENAAMAATGGVGHALILSDRHGRPEQEPFRPRPPASGPPIPVPSAPEAQGSLALQLDTVRLRFFRFGDGHFENAVAVAGLHGLRIDLAPDNMRAPSSTLTKMSSGFTPEGSTWKR
jgi:hypothetical protein